jgi:hypothetical protein
MDIIYHKPITTGGDLKDMAQFQTTSLIKSYRDHNAMLNDAVLDALVHIVETTEDKDKETAEPRITKVEEKPQK